MTDRLRRWPRTPSEVAIWLRWLCSFPAKFELTLLLIFMAALALMFAIRNLPGR